MAITQVDWWSGVMCVPVSSDGERRAQSLSFAAADAVDHGGDDIIDER